MCVCERESVSVCVCVGGIERESGGARNLKSSAGSGSSARGTTMKCQLSVNFQDTARASLTEGELLYRKSW